MRKKVQRGRKVVLSTGNRQTDKQTLEMTVMAKKRGGRRGEEEEERKKGGGGRGEEERGKA